jgi:predicted short-subunit dehydrogenase-like oxidoreductase (DUF2520 family)
VAATLARRGLAVAVRDRDAARARALARRLGLPAARSRRWDLVVLAVPDRAIPAAARALVREGLRPSFAVHLSGATPAEALAPLARAGWRTAKLHPVFAFSSEPAILPRGVAFGVSAPDAAGLKEAGALARRLGGRPVAIRTGMDAAWHLATVLAGNAFFAQGAAALAVMRMAAALERGTGDALAPLFRSSLDNALREGMAGGLTGPLARGDARTLAAHARALQGLPPPITALYSAVCTLLADLLPRGRRAAARRALDRAGLLI